MQVLCKAPGKIVLIGEYAVLLGAPALVMAVDRYATASVTKTSNSYCTIHSNYSTTAQTQFTLTTPITLDQEYRLFTTIIEELIKNEDVLFDHKTSFDLDLNTCAFYLPGSNTEKYGFGSSAALTVSLVLSLLQLDKYPIQLENSAKWLEKCLAVHRTFQRGHGSGLDIAASLYGKVIAFETTNASLHPSVSYTDLHPSLQFVCIYSGESASTTSFVQQFHAWREQNAASRDLVDSLMTIANRVVKEQLYCQPQMFLNAIKDYSEVLLSISKMSKIPIYSPGHCRLLTLAENSQVAYKPCGAGGGDVGMAWDLDPMKLAQFAEKVTAAGFKIIDVNIASSGVILETNHKF